MHIEYFRSFCLSFDGVTEEMPFDNQTLVFKVMGKIFALAGIDDFQGFNVKCDPEKAVELRAQYPCVQPGYHMNKKHWNTIRVNEDLSDPQLEHWVRHSYELVVSKLPKKLKEDLRMLKG